MIYFLGMKQHCIYKVINACAMLVDTVSELEGWNTFIIQTRKLKYHTDKKQI